MLLTLSTELFLIKLFSQNPEDLITSALIVRCTSFLIAMFSFFKQLLQSTKGLDINEFVERTKSFTHSTSPKHLNESTPWFGTILRSLAAYGISEFNAAEQYQVAESFWRAFCIAKPVLESTSPKSDAVKKLKSQLKIEMNRESFRLLCRSLHAREYVKVTHQDISFEIESKLFTNLSDCALSCATHWAFMDLPIDDAQKNISDGEFFEIISTGNSTFQSLETTCIDCGSKTLTVENKLLHHLHKHRIQGISMIFKTPYGVSKKPAFVVT